MGRRPPGVRVQFIVFDFVVPGRRTYDARGRRVFRDTMNDTSETLCDDRVESSPLWDLRLAAGRACARARDGQGVLRGFCFCCGRAGRGEFTDGRLRRGDFGLASLAGALPPRGLGSEDVACDRDRPHTTTPAAVLPRPRERRDVLGAARDGGRAQLAVRGARSKCDCRRPSFGRGARRVTKGGVRLGAPAFGLSLATFRRHTEAAAALEKALADPMIAASSSAGLAAPTRRRSAPWRRRPARGRSRSCPPGPWSWVFLARRASLRINGDAPLGDLLGGVDEAARRRLIDPEGRP